MGIVASRIYLAALIASILAFLLFNGLTQTTYTYTIQSPTLAIFEQLQDKYPGKLTCPCDQIAVPYGIFLSINPSFHQVCTSGFITELWTTSLYGFGNLAKVGQQLDRPILSTQHQILGKICRESELIVDEAVSNLRATSQLSADALPRSVFTSKNNLIIEQFIQQIPLRFRRIVVFVSEFLSAGTYPSAFATDWIIEFGNAANSYVSLNNPRLYANGTCNCVVSSACKEPLKIGPPDLILPGLFVGCYPINGLRLSTLECFYSLSCIQTILSYLEYYQELDGSPPTNFTLPVLLPFNIDPLNYSVASRFSPTTTIGQIIDELLIESWNKTISYENYFNACAPTQCRYEYKQRNNALYVVTSIIAVYGGLTISLRFIAWNATRIYYIKKFSRRNPCVSVAPRMTIVSTSNDHFQDILHTVHDDK